MACGVIILLNIILMLNCLMWNTNVECDLINVYVMLKISKEILCGS